MNLLLYFSQVVLLLIVGLLLYHKGLKPLRWFNISRWWLFFLPPFAILLPYISSMISVPYAPGEEIVVTLNTVRIGLVENSAPIEGANSGAYFTSITVGLIVYLVGLLYFLFKLIIDINGFKKFLSHAMPIDETNGVRIYSYDGHLPFTFMNRIYLPGQIDRSSEDYELVLTHELTHVKEKHWVDNFWLMGWSLILWFIPVMRGIRSAIQEVHEFQADAATVNRFGPKNYLCLIVSMLKSDYHRIENLNTVSPFISKTIKTRIMMITDKKISWKLPTFTIALSFLLIGGLGFMSCQSEQAGIESEMEEVMETHGPKPSEETILEVAEQMPRFPGCEGMPASQEEKKACADQKMLEFIYQNISYPAIARENGIEGTTVIQFVIDTEGVVQDPKIVRDIGGGCGHEALRVVKMMNEMPERWTPGMHEGQAVNIRFNLPVRFALQ